MKRTTWVLLSYVVLFDFAAFLLVFSIGRALAESGATQQMMGFAGAGFSATLALASFLSGRASHRIGRRRLILIGNAGLLLSLGGCAIVGLTHPACLLLYGAAGAAAGTTYPSIYAWLSEGRNPQGSLPVSGAVILFCLAWNTGILCGQVVGGALFVVDRMWPIYLATALAAVCFPLLAAAGQREPAPVETQPTASCDAHSHQIMSAAFARLAWMSNLGAAFAMSMVIHLFPKLAYDLGIVADRHGLLLAATRATVIATYFVLLATSRWRMSLPTALCSQMMAIVGLALICVAGDVWTILVGLICVSQMSGFNYFASLYYSTGGSSDERRAAASGIHEATLAFGFAGGSAIGGVVGQHWGVRSPYALAAGVIVAMACLQVIYYVRTVKPIRHRLTMLAPQPVPIEETIL